MAGLNIASISRGSDNIGSVVIGWLQSKTNTVGVEIKCIMHDN